MVDLLDLFDDPPAPAPRPESQRAAPAPRPAARSAPTMRLHLCESPGCTAWGSHGIFNGDMRSSQWWCRAHLPASFFNFRDAAREGLQSPARP